MVDGKNSFPKNSAIVYHVTELADKSGSTARTCILDSAVKRFLDIKQLLSTLEELRNVPPMTVITENTQHCPARDTINYIGSELWGMIRSAMHENFNKNIKLVDIDKNTLDVIVLLHLLFSSSQSGTEFAISGSKLLRANIQSAQRTEKIRRPITMSKTDKMAIYSSNSKEISEPYLMLSGDTEFERLLML